MAFHGGHKKTIAWNTNQAYGGLFRQPHAQQTIRVMRVPTSRSGKHSLTQIIGEVVAGVIKVPMRSHSSQLLTCMVAYTVHDRKVRSSFGSPVSVHIQEHHLSIAILVEWVHKKEHSSGRLVAGNGFDLRAIC